MRRHALLILLMAVLLSAVGTSRESGIDSDGNDGCNCHGVRGELEITLTGLPDSFESSKTYELIVEFGGVNDAAAGFRLVVDGGSIESSDSGVQYLDGGWTHTLEGNTNSVWNLTWIAPEDNSTVSTFVLHVNDADGNGEYTGDEWDSRSYAVAGVGHQGEVEAPELADGSMTTIELVIAGLALAILAGVLWYSMKE